MDLATRMGRSLDTWGAGKVLTGCANHPGDTVATQVSQFSAQGLPAASPSATTATKLPATQAAEAPTLTVWDGQVDAADGVGDTATMHVSIGPVQTPQQAGVNLGTCKELLTTSSLDPGRALVQKVSGDFEVTSSMATKLGLYFHASADYALSTYQGTAPVRLYMLWNFTEGWSCTPDVGASGGGGLWVNYDNPLGPGLSHEFAGWVIYPNVVTPNHPSATMDDLGPMFLTPRIGFGSTAGVLLGSATYSGPRALTCDANPNGPMGFLMFGTKPATVTRGPGYDNGFTCH